MYKYIEIIWLFNKNVIARADVSNQSMVDVMETLEPKPIDRLQNTKRTLILSKVPLKTFNIDGEEVHKITTNINT